MKFLDSRFRKNKSRYIFQCLLATVAALIVLLVIEPLRHAAIVASLGSSAFVVFAVPHRALAGSRKIIGGYAVGILSGALCFWLLQWVQLEQGSLSLRIVTAAYAALAVGLAVFVMVITNTEHAPAAGVALGLVIDEWSAPGMLLVFFGVICLAGIRRLLKPILIDLL